MSVHEEKCYIKCEINEELGDNSVIIEEDPLDIGESNFEIPNTSKVNGYMDFLSVNDRDVSAFIRLACAR